MVTRKKPNELDTVLIEQILPPDTGAGQSRYDELIAKYPFLGNEDLLSTEDRDLVVRALGYNRQAPSREPVAPVAPVEVEPASPLEGYDPSSVTIPTSIIPKEEPEDPEERKIWEDDIRRSFFYDQMQSQRRQAQDPRVQESELIPGVPAYSELEEQVFSMLALPQTKFEELEGMEGATPQFRRLYNWVKQKRKKNEVAADKYYESYLSNVATHNVDAMLGKLDLEAPTTKVELRPLPFLTLPDFPFDLPLAEEFRQSYWRHLEDRNHEGDYGFGEDDYGPSDLFADTVVTMASEAGGNPLAWMRSLVEDAYWMWHGPVEDGNPSAKKPEDSQRPVPIMRVPSTPAQELAVRHDEELYENRPLHVAMVNALAEKLGVSPEEAMGTYDEILRNNMTYAERRNAGGANFLQKAMLAMGSLELAEGVASYLYPRFNLRELGGETPLVDFSPGGSVDAERAVLRFGLTRAETGETVYDQWGNAIFAKYDRPRVDLREGEWYLTPFDYAIDLAWPFGRLVAGKANVYIREAADRALRQRYGPGVWDSSVGDFIQVRNRPLASRKFDPVPEATAARRKAEEVGGPFAEFDEGYSPRDLEMAAETAARTPSYAEKIRRTLMDQDAIIVAIEENIDAAEKVVLKIRQASEETVDRLNQSKQGPVQRIDGQEYGPDYLDQYRRGQRYNVKEPRIVSPSQARTEQINEFNRIAGVGEKEAYIQTLRDNLKRYKNTRYKTYMRGGFFVTAPRAATNLMYSTGASMLYTNYEREMLAEERMGNLQDPQYLRMVALGLAPLAPALMGGRGGIAYLLRRERTGRQWERFGRQRRGVFTDGPFAATKDILFPRPALADAATVDVRLRGEQLETFNPEDQDILRRIFAEEYGENSELDELLNGGDVASSLSENQQIYFTVRRTKKGEDLLSSPKAPQSEKAAEELAAKGPTKSSPEVQYIYSPGVKNMEGFFKANSFHGLRPDQIDDIGITLVEDGVPVRYVSFGDQRHNANLVDDVLAKNLLESKVFSDSQAFAGTTVRPRSAGRQVMDALNASRNRETVTVSTETGPSIDIVLPNGETIPAAGSGRVVGVEVNEPVTPRAGDDSRARTANPARDAVEESEGVAAPESAPGVNTNAAEQAVQDVALENAQRATDATKRPFIRVKKLVQNGEISPEEGKILSDQNITQVSRDGYALQVAGKDSENRQVYVILDREFKPLRTEPLRAPEVKEWLLSQVPFVDPRPPRAARAARAPETPAAKPEAPETPAAKPEAPETPAAKPEAKPKLWSKEKKGRGNQGREQRNDGYTVEFDGKPKPPEWVFRDRDGNEVLRASGKKGDAKKQFDKKFPPTEEAPAAAKPPTEEAPAAAKPPTEEAPAAAKPGKNEWSKTTEDNRTRHTRKEDGAYLEYETRKGWILYDQKGKALKTYGETKRKKGSGVSALRDNVDKDFPLAKQAEAEAPTDPAPSTPSAVRTQLNKEDNSGGFAFGKPVGWNKFELESGDTLEFMLRGVRGKPKVHKALVKLNGERVPDLETEYPTRQEAIEGARQIYDGFKGGSSTPRPETPPAAAAPAPETPPAAAASAPAPETPPAPVERVTFEKASSARTRAKEAKDPDKHLYVFTDGSVAKKRYSRGEGPVAERPFFIAYHPKDQNFHIVQQGIGDEADQVLLTGTKGESANKVVNRWNELRNPRSKQTPPVDQQGDVSLVQAQRAEVLPDENVDIDTSQAAAQEAKNQGFDANSARAFELVDKDGNVKPGVIYTSKLSKYAERRVVLRDQEGNIFLAYSLREKRGKLNKKTGKRGRTQFEAYKYEVFQTDDGQGGVRNNFVRKTVEFERVGKDTDVARGGKSESKLVEKSVPVKPFAKVFVTENTDDGKLKALQKLEAKVNKDAQTEIEAVLDAQLDLDEAARSIARDNLLAVNDRYFDDIGDLTGSTRKRVSSRSPQLKAGRREEESLVVYDGRTYRLPKFVGAAGLNKFAADRNLTVKSISKGNTVEGETASAWLWRTSGQKAAAKEKPFLTVTSGEAERAAVVLDGRAYPLEDVDAELFAIDLHRAKDPNKNIIEGLDHGTGHRSVSLIVGKDAAASAVNTYNNFMVLLRGLVDEAQRAPASFPPSRRPLRQVGTEDRPRLVPAPQVQRSTDDWLDGVVDNFLDSEVNVGHFTPGDLKSAQGKRLRSTLRDQLDRFVRGASDASDMKRIFDVYTTNRQILTGTKSKQAANLLAPSDLSLPSRLRPKGTSTDLGGTFRESSLAPEMQPNRQIQIEQEQRAAAEARNAALLADREARRVIGKGFQGDPKRLLDAENLDISPTVLPGDMAMEPRGFVRGDTFYQYPEGHPLKEPMPDLPPTQRRHDHPRPPIKASFPQQPQQQTWDVLQGEFPSSPWPRTESAAPFEPMGASQPSSSFLNRRSRAQTIGADRVVNPKPDVIEANDGVQAPAWPWGPSPRTGSLGTFVQENLPKAGEAAQVVAVDLKNQRKNAKLGKTLVVADMKGKKNTVQVFANVPVAGRFKANEVGDMTSGANSSMPRDVHGQASAEVDRRMLTATETRGRAGSSDPMSVNHLINNYQRMPAFMSQPRGEFGPDFDERSLWLNSKPQKVPTEQQREAAVRNTTGFDAQEMSDYYRNNDPLPPPQDGLAKSLQNTPVGRTVDVMRNLASYLIHTDTGKLMSPAEELGLHSRLIRSYVDVGGGRYNEPRSATAAAVRAALGENVMNNERILNYRIRDVAYARSLYLKTLKDVEDLINEGLQKRGREWGLDIINARELGVLDEGIAVPELDLSARQVLDAVEEIKQAIIDPYSRELEAIKKRFAVNPDDVTEIDRFGQHFIPHIIDPIATIVEQVRMMMRGELSEEFVMSRFGGGNNQAGIDQIKSVVRSNLEGRADLIAAEMTQATKALSELDGSTPGLSMLDDLISGEWGDQIARAAMDAADDAAKHGPPQTGRAGAKYPIKQRGAPRGRPDVGTVLDRRTGVQREVKAEQSRFADEFPAKHPAFDFDLMRKMHDLMGFRLKTYNPVELLRIQSVKMAEFITRARLLDDLQKRGLVTAMPESEFQKIRNRSVALNGASDVEGVSMFNRFPQQDVTNLLRDMTEVADWQKAARRVDGKKIPRTDNFVFVASPETAQVLSNHYGLGTTLTARGYLSRSPFEEGGDILGQSTGNFRGKDALNKYRKVSNFQNMVQLGLSAFHWGTIAMEGVSTNAELALRKGVLAAKGAVKGTLKNLDAKVTGKKVRHETDLGGYYEELLEKYAKKRGLQIKDVPTKMRNKIARHAVLQLTTESMAHVGKAVPGVALARATGQSPKRMQAHGVLKGGLHSVLAHTPVASTLLTNRLKTLPVNDALRDLPRWKTRLLFREQKIRKSGKEEVVLIPRSFRGAYQPVTRGLSKVFEKALDYKRLYGENFSLSGSIHKGDMFDWADFAPVGKQMDAIYKGILPSEDYDPTYRMLVEKVAAVNGRGAGWRAEYRKVWDNTWRNQFEQIRMQNPDSSFWDVAAIIGGRGKPNVDRIPGRAMTTGLAKGAAAGAVEYVEDFSKFLFETLIPEAKMAAFLDMAQFEMKKLGSDLTPELFEFRLNRAWNSIDNRFGQLIYDNLFLNRAVRDTMMLVQRAPGWNWGTMRELYGGVLDLARGPLSKSKAISRFDDEYLTPRMAYLFAQTAAVGIYGGLYQLFTTGELPALWQDTGEDTNVVQKFVENYLRWAQPLTGNYVNGRWERLSFPTNQKDFMSTLFDFPNGFTTMLSHKLAPPLVMGKELFTNKRYGNMRVLDYDRISDHPFEQAKNLAGWAASHYVPFNVGQIYDQINSHASSTGEVAFRSVTGTTAAPLRLSSTRSKRILSDMRTRGTFDAPPLRETETRELRSQLLNLLLQKRYGGPLSEEELKQEIKTTTSDFVSHFTSKDDAKRHINQLRKQAEGKWDGNFWALELEALRPDSQYQWLDFLSALTRQEARDILSHPDAKKQIVRVTNYVTNNTAIDEKGEFKKRAAEVLRRVFGKKNLSSPVAKRLTFGDGWLPRIEDSFQTDEARQQKLSQERFDKSRARGR